MINLKNRLAVCMVLAIVCLLPMSCEFEHDNNGYPSQVTFTKEGGKKTIYGNKYFSNLYIENNSSNISDGCCEEILKDTLDASYDWENIDSLTASYDWLTVKTKFHSNELEIYVSPMKDGKKRKLKIDGSFGTEYAEITVVQK